MNWINKLIKARNIKWLIKQHELEMWAISKTAMKESSRHSIEWGDRENEPHKKEIERLYKQLEEL